MRKACQLLIFLMISSFVLVACGGGGGDDPPPPPAEVNLAVTTDPANNSVQAPALGPYNLKVTITSAMPANGVKIEVTARKDDGSGSPAFYTTAPNSTTSVNNYTITNTPANTQCLVIIKVTSLTNSTNTWSGSYRYSSK